jgi:uncharacterized protein YjaZ
MLYPDFVPQWTRALTGEEKAKLWRQIQDSLDSTDPRTIDRFIFGGGVDERDAVPRQAGYTIGFDIVQAWLKQNPNVPPTEWSRLSPREILEGSGYAP